MHSTILRILRTKISRPLHTRIRWQPLRSQRGFSSAKRNNQNTLLDHPPPMMPESSLAATAADAQQNHAAAKPDTATTAKSVCGPTIASHPEIYPYLLQHSLRQTPEQAALMKEIEVSERAAMAGAPEEAQFLQFLVEVMGAKKVLEVGVFRGSTTLALAQAVGEGGKVYGLDLNADWAASGQKYWKQAGVEDRIEFMLGSASDLMGQLLAKGHAASFDLVFVDANKTDYDTYYEKSLELLKPGGVVAVDNTLWHGRLEDPEWQDDEDTIAIKALNDKLHKDERVSMVMLSIADGLTLCRKR